MRPLLAAVLLASVAGCAGPAHPWSRATLCEGPRPAADEPAAWLGLLLRGWDAGTRRATAPAVDCTGAQVRWDAPALQCEDDAAARATLPDRPLGAEDVVVEPLGEDFRLVWVITSRYAGGDGLGPVAVVERKPRALVVRALGHLRANVVRPKLRLEKMGEREVLVAEGEVCGGADPSSCARSARVMPLRGERWAPATVNGDDGRCVSPAFLHLGREEVEPLPSGWRRRYRLDAQLAFDAKGAVLREQVVVKDFDPKHPNTPERLFRRAGADQELRFDGAAFVSAGPSLWTRMRSAR